MLPLELLAGVLLKTQLTPVYQHYGNKKLRNRDSWVMREGACRPTSRRNEEKIMKQKGTLNILRGTEEESSRIKKDTLNDLRGIDEESSLKPRSH